MPSWLMILRRFRDMFFNLSGGVISTSTPIDAVKRTRFFSYGSMWMLLAPSLMALEQDQRSMRRTTGASPLASLELEDVHLFVPVNSDLRLPRSVAMTSVVRGAKWRVKVLDLSVRDRRLFAISACSRGEELEVVDRVFVILAIAR